MLLSPARINQVLYRAPNSDYWEPRPLEWAMDRIAERVKQARDETFVTELEGGTKVNHTLGIGSLGGATLDNEENYLMKKLFGGGLGMVNIENQAQNLTLRLGPQFGDHLRTRRGDHGPLGPGRTAMSSPSWARTWRRIIPWRSAS